jgi:hypothetical protein
MPRVNYLWFLYLPPVSLTLYSTVLYCTMVFPPHFYRIEALAVTLCSCRCSRRLLVTLVQSWAGHTRRIGTKQGQSARLGLLPLSSPISAGHLASAACALVVLSVLIAGALPARRATLLIRQALCSLYHVSRPPFWQFGAHPRSMDSG